MALRPLRFLEDVYSALYGFSLNRWHGDDYMASFLTACTVAGALAANFLLLAGGIVAVSGPGIFGGALPRMLIFVVLITILAGSYGHFVHNRRYETLFHRFSEKPDRLRRRVAVTAWTYIIVSYMLPIVFFITVAHEKTGQ